ncbi:hypothetical protein JCM9957A_51320 [Kineosporia succinea]
MLFSRASLRTSGVAKRRSPSSAGFSATAALVAAFGSATAAGAASAAGAGVLSPVPLSRRAMGVPIATFSPSATRISASVPAS